MPNQPFEDAYQRLNPQQRQAVDTIEGPVMVAAGPGTGKTQILTLRIANICLKTDTAPESILALTFTEAGAATMRRKLIEIMGAAAYRVTINTFHGFCNDIIKEYPDEFPHIIASQNITEVDQVRLLEDIINTLPLKDLRPYGEPLLYLRDIQHNIDTLKREAVGVDEFEKIVQQEQKDFDAKDDLYHEKGAHKGKMKLDYQKLQQRITKSKEFAKVYRAYQERLVKEKFYDYSDMIMEVLRALSENQTLLLMLQEQYQYFLVDEHQDTNKAQNKIVELLCNFHENPNIFVVGDEKQAIYRFQGASAENFRYFQELYPNAKLIVLEQNYRSTQAILDGAHSLAKKIAATEAPLHANMAYDNLKANLYSFSRPEVEWYFLANDIQAKLAGDVKPEEIAVLYRENHDAFPLARALEKFGIAYVIESNQDIMSDADIKKLLLILRAVYQLSAHESLPQAQRALIEAMHVDFLEIPPLDIFKITEHASSAKTSVFDIVRSQEILDSLHLEKPESVSEFSAKLAEWATRSRNIDFTPFFEQILQESGYLKYILKATDAVERMDKLMGLYGEVSKLVEAHRDCTLQDFLQYLDTLEEHRVPVRKVVSSQPQHRVRLMTAHGSKGQEFDYVYIVQANDGHWGNKRQKNRLPLPARVFALTSPEMQEDEANEDERRLFYVALTRARRGVAISYAREGMTGREQIVSQFIQEIAPEYLMTGNSELYEVEYQAHKEVFLTPKEAVDGERARLQDKEFVQEIFLRNGLSASSLNSYLECPWRYFYENLLRLPRAKTKFEMYGTAMHAALQDFFTTLHQTTTDPGLELLLRKFLLHLHRQPISSRDLLELEEKGREALSGYYKKYHAEWTPNILAEFNVYAVMLTSELRLTGKIDKMEFLPSSVNEVNVVDYKSSKPLTRGQIEGTTKDSQGNYKRQLVFYKLLLDNYEKQKYRMTSGEIDFLEPNEKGEYKKEKFEIAAEEIAELKTTILRVAAEIMNLAFWNMHCDNRDCEYCKLREVMG